MDAAQRPAQFTHHREARGARQFGLPQRHARHARQQRVLDVAAVAPIAQHARDREVGQYGLDLLQKENFLLQAGAWAQLLRALRLQDKPVVNEVCARLAAGLIYGGHPLRVRHVPPRQAQYEVIVKHRVGCIWLHINVFGQGYTSGC